MLTLVALRVFIKDIKKVNTFECLLYYYSFKKALHETNISEKRLVLSFSHMTICL